MNHACTMTPIILQALPSHFSLQCSGDLAVSYTSDAVLKTAKRCQPTFGGAILQIASLQSTGLSSHSPLLTEQHHVAFGPRLGLDTLLEH